jgi:ubiquilin
MSLSVNFKLSGAGNSLSLDLEPCLTILAVKALLKEYAKAEPEHMKLIFKGRILKDTDTLESSKIEAGQSMHVVKSAGSTSTANPLPAAPATAAADAPTGHQADALAGMAGAGAGGANPMAAMMQDPAMMQAAMQMMGGTGTPGGVTAGGADPMAAMMGGMGGNSMGGMDPAMMSQMMQNPMVQQMMQNLMQDPAMLQQMIQSNPMLQQMTQNNPMMAQMISNPQFMQSAMQMVSNPQIMQAMGGMQAPALEGGGQQPVVPPVVGEGGMNPMAAMMQDPGMMQAMMGMMGGAGGAGRAGMPGGAPGGANPFGAMMGGAAPTPARCACGNFESGRGDGLCNSCRNASATQSPP